MKKILCFLGKIVLVVLAVFVILFAVYFFNLDMKFIAKFIDPFLQKHYDKIPRKQYV